MAEQSGIPHWIDFYRKVKLTYLFDDGEWDAFLAEYRGDAEHQFQFAFVSLARGDLDAARRGSVDLIEAAGRSGRTDERAEPLALRVLVLRALQDQQAPDAVDELVSLLPTIALWLGTTPLIGLILADAGRGDALLAATEAVPTSPILQAVRLYASGDFAAAADGFAESEEPLIEALARLRAGERLVGEGQHAQADGELRRALAFFRKARATMFIDEAEQLLSATA